MFKKGNSYGTLTKGIKRTVEQKAHQSLIKRGIHYSPKTEFKKGMVGINRGIRKYIKNCKNCGVEFKTSSKILKYCSKECSGFGIKTTYNKVCKGCNREFNTNTKRDVYCSKKCYLKNGTSWNKGNVGYLAGEKHYNWKGGITPLNQEIRTSYHYIYWRKDIMLRDKFSCQLCGDNKGNNLEVHHKYPLYKLIKEYSIKSLDDAINCSHLWNLDNGITLCIACHCKVDKFRRSWK